MADTTPPASSDTSTASSRATEQARLRKERREAKIRAGGSARLNKISGLGGVQRDPLPQPASSTDEDPEEVDISQHYYEPSPLRASLNNNASSIPNQQEQISEKHLRQMMLGFDPSSTPPPPYPNSNPFAGFPGASMDGMGGGVGGPGADDPMMKMLQQMMGGIPGEGAGGMPAFPGMPGMPGQEVAVQADPYAYLWRIIHTVFALGLGLYIAFTIPFTGSRVERESSGIGYVTGEEREALTAASVHFFWIFATAEVLLQSSRFFLEKGRVLPGGIMGMILGFLPEPWKGYLMLLGRYLRIWTTVTGDALVCVFVLGVCAWWRGT